jgi:hypothetical protein
MTDQRSRQSRINRAIPWLILAVIGLLLFSACCTVEQPDPTQEPAATATATATSTPIPTESPPTDTPVPPPTDTPLPTATDTPVPTSTPPPTATNTPAPTAVLVTDARVVYHGGVEQDGVGIYEKGTLPWMDLLVQLNGIWYGPEREPDDEIAAQALPDGYRWECEGGFGCHPNGEAWWSETSEEGTARLVGPGEAVLAETELKVAFHGGGGGLSPTSDPGPTPTPPPTAGPDWGND